MDKVPMIMTRIILYVRNVESLKTFYQTHFDVPVVEEIRGEWAVLKAATESDGPLLKNQTVSVLSPAIAGLPLG